MFESAKPALIIVDVQEAIDCYSQKQRNNPDAETVIASLLSRWCHRGLPVIHVRHSSKFDSSPYHAKLRVFRLLRIWCARSQASWLLLKLKTVPLLVPRSIRS